MDNQYVIERIMKNLAFELKPGPIKESKEDSSSSDPLSVKIRIKNKQTNDTTSQRYISNNQLEPEMFLQKVRLVNSDETLMSFYMLMEKDYRQDLPRQPRKYPRNFFDKLKPGLCLKPMDDSDHVYQPSSNLNQQFKLSNKDVDTFGNTGNPRREKSFLGTKCKPGGCLDPSMDEDRYTYSPNLQVSFDEDAKIQAKVKPEDSDVIKSKHTYVKKNNNKSKDHIKPIDDGVSISKKESLILSLITYPTHDENNKKNMYTSHEDRQSLTESINVIFNPPKGIKRNSNTYPQQSKKNSVNQIMQKNMIYLKQNEPQYQQQLDSMAASNMKSKSDINFNDITNNENSIYCVEATEKEQNEKGENKITIARSIPSNCESINSLSKELKVVKYPESKIHIKYPGSINEVDTSAVTGKKKKKKTFLGSKCKPGGCLDPSFDEDTYTYSPSIQVLSKQDSSMAKPKQENSYINLTPNYISRTKNIHKDVPVLIKPSNKNNMKSHKINAIDSMIDPTYTSNDAINTQDTVNMSLENYLYENNLKYSNNNSINSFLKPCNEFQEDLNQNEQHSSSTCSLLDTNNVKLEPSEKLVSSLPTFLSSEQGPSASINNDMQTPNRKQPHELLEQESAFKYNEDEEISKPLIMQNSVNLHVNTDLTSLQINSVSDADYLTSNTESVITNDTADLITHVAALNSHSEQYFTSVNVDNTQEDTKKLANQIIKNITIKKDNVELKPIKIFGEYSNNTIDLKTDNNKSSHLHIPIKESSKSIYITSDNDEDKIAIEKKQIISNKFEQLVENESMNSLFSRSNEFESNSKLPQTSTNCNLDTAVKIESTEKSPTLLHLSTSSEQNVSISTIQSIYTKSSTNLPQSFQSAKIIGHKEISVTTSVTVLSHLSLEPNIITKENVCLEDIKQATTDYFIIADTTDFIDEIDAAINYEDDIHQFKKHQNNMSNLFIKIEEGKNDKIQLNSELIKAQIVINSEKVECGEIKLTNSNKPNIERQAVELSTNTIVIEDNLTKSPYDKTFNDNASTTDIIDKIDAAINYEDNMHQFNVQQNSINNSFSKTEETKIDVIQLNSQLILDQTAIISDKIEFSEIKLVNSNEPVTEKEAVIAINTLVIKHNLTNSPDSKIFNDDGDNQSTDNNKNVDIGNENQEYQYQNQCSYDIKILKDQPASFISKTEIKLRKSDVLFDTISKIDQEARIEIRDQPNNEFENKNPIKCDSNHKDDFNSSEAIVKIVCEHPDSNNSQYIPSTAKQIEVPADIHKNKLEKIERSERPLVSLEDTSLDIINLDLIFHSYQNYKNHRIIRTITDKNEVKRYPNDCTFILKSQVKLSHNKNNQKISIPLGSDIGMTIKIENFSGDVCSKTTKESVLACNQTNIEQALNKVDERTYLDHRTNINDQAHSTLTHIYEKNLLPLQKTIRNLKYEIDALAKQQTLLKKEVFCVKQTKLQVNHYCNKKSKCKNVNNCMYRKW